MKKNIVKTIALIGGMIFLMSALSTMLENMLFGILYGVACGFIVGTILNFDFAYRRKKATIFVHIIGQIILVVSNVIVIQDVMVAVLFSLALMCITAGILLYLIFWNIEKLIGKYLIENSILIIIKKFF